MTPGAGDKVADRYLLEELLGSGGMGVVWRAWDERLERRVAVKCARPDGERAAQRLMKEARNAARLHHPNIVGVFDFVDEGAACWIVMEYVPSRSLARIVGEQGPLTPEEAGSIGRQIADALAKSHTEGVVHGDVTPENILVTEDGVAKLTDFGISRALWTDVTQTTAGVVRGKPKYLAPEVAKGLPADGMSDVFSLGATLFAAVEGRSPYGEAEHPVAYVARAVEGRVDPAGQAGLLAEPLKALLAAEPRRRPDAAQARQLLTLGAPPSPHVRVRPRNGLRAPLALLRRSLRRSLRRPLPVTAVAVAVAAAVTAGLVLSGAGDNHGDGKGVAGAKPSAAPTTPAAGKPGTIGDDRTADPCGLLDAASLSRFGANELDPDYGEFDRCDVLVRNRSGDDNADVQVNLDADQDEFDGDLSTRLVGDITVVTLEREGNACERAVMTADHKQIRIIGKQLGTPSPDPCELADAATDHVVGVLDDGPVPRRPSAPDRTSLARADACELLDAASLARVPGVRVENRDRGYGSWDCDWSSDDGVREVEIQFSRDNSLEDDGRPVDVDGIRSHAIANEAEDDSCTVRTPHRTYTDAAGDRTIELFQLTVYAPQPTGQLCDSAAALAATVVRNIAKPR